MIMICFYHTFLVLWIIPIVQKFPIKIYKTFNIYNDVKQKSCKSTYLRNFNLRIFVNKITDDKDNNQSWPF